MEHITIGGKEFLFIKKRVYEPVTVYQGENCYLRKGPKNILGPELDTHKNLLNCGFPIAKILREGEFEGEFYYIEESLGSTLFGELFKDDCLKGGKISEDNFNNFLAISKLFAEAQFKTVQNDRYEENFYLGIHMHYALSELPDFKDKILEAFKKVGKNTAGLPYVLTHGDLNPHNMFEKGVIDFGSAFHAPIGHDLVGNIYHTYNFPKEGDFESMRRYNFTKEQINTYMKEMDKIYIGVGLPKLSEFVDDFIFSKLVWSTVRMDRYPKLRSWRYDKFIYILEKYLAGESIGSAHAI